MILESKVGVLMIEDAVNVGQLSRVNGEVVGRLRFVGEELL